eukprot:s3051_g13.t1
MEKVNWARQNASTATFRRDKKLAILASCGSLRYHLAGLEWLVSTSQPGDHLLLVFSGYGCQHPRSPGSEKCESYLVPSDFADELPKDFFKIMENAGARMDNTALGGIQERRVTLSRQELQWSGPLTQATGRCVRIQHEDRAISLIDKEIEKMQMLSQNGFINSPSSRAVPMPRFFTTDLTGPPEVVPIEDSDSSMPATVQTSRLGPRQSEDLSMPMSTAPSDEQTLQNSGSQTGSQAHSTMYGTSALANATTATTNSNSSGSDFDIPGVSQISSEESKESEPPPAPLQVFNTLEQHQNGTCKPCRFFQLHWPQASIVGCVPTERSVVAQIGPWVCAEKWRCDVAPTTVVAELKLL